MIVRTIATEDTLSTMANYYDISLEALAYANAISEEARGSRSDTSCSSHRPRARSTRSRTATPSKARGPLQSRPRRDHVVQPRVLRARAIRCGSAGVRSRRDDPPLKRTERNKTITIPASAALPARTGRLGLPVNGVFTQYFWWGHSGVDIAAPYGTGLGASDDGIVVATGPVPVGGLGVRVQHSGGLEKLLLPHERGVRDPRADRRARTAHRGDRTHRCHDGSSRALGAQGQRSATEPARVLSASAARRSDVGRALSTRPRSRALSTDGLRLLVRDCRPLSPCRRGRWNPAASGSLPHTPLVYRAVHADRAGRIIVSDHAAAAFDGATTVPFSDAVRLPTGASVTHIERDARNARPIGARPACWTGSSRGRGRSAPRIPAHPAAGVRGRARQPGSDAAWYAAVAADDAGDLVVAALLIDRDPTHDVTAYPRAETAAKVNDALRSRPADRLVRQLARCAREYACRAAANAFYRRWECALPVAAPSNEHPPASIAPRLDGEADPRGARSIPPDRGGGRNARDRAHRGGRNASVVRARAARASRSSPVACSRTRYD